MLNVLIHTDDLPTPRRVQQSNNALTDRVFVRKVAVSQPFIDETNLRSASAVTRVEPPTRAQRNLHCLQVARRHGGDFGSLKLPWFQTLPSLDFETEVCSLAAEWQ